MLRCIYHNSFGSNCAIRAASITHHRVFQVNTFAVCNILLLTITHRFVWTRAVILIELLLSILILVLQKIVIAAYQDCAV